MAGGVGGEKVASRSAAAARIRVSIHDLVKRPGYRRHESLEYKELRRKGCVVCP